MILRTHLQFSHHSEEAEAKCLPALTLLLVSFKHILVN